MHEWRDGLADESTEEWMNGWTDGRTDCLIIKLGFDFLSFFGLISNQIGCWRLSIDDFFKFEQICKISSNHQDRQTSNGLFRLLIKPSLPSRIAGRLYSSRCQPLLFSIQSTKTQLHLLWFWVSISVRNCRLEYKLKSFLLISCLPPFSGLSFSRFVWQIKTKQDEERSLS